MGFSHQALELVLGEAHVFGCDAVVEVQAGVEDQRVVGVQGVVRLVLPEPEPRKRRNRTENQSNRSNRSASEASLDGLRDDGMLGEVWVAGTSQLTGKGADLWWDHQQLAAEPAEEASQEDAPAQSR